jgi:hypothetical protein
MKKRIVTAVALLALTATMAEAGTVNFYWTDCVGNGGTSNKNFANCTTTVSSATDAAAGSFIPSNAMTDFVAVEIVLDLQTEAASVPAWWDFNPSPTQCHGSSLAMTFDFTSFANGSGACTDPFGAPATGSLANYEPAFNGAANRARVIGVAAIDASNPQVLAAGTEYYGFRLALKKDKSTGAGSCAGCDTPVAIVLNSLRAVGSGLGSFEDNTAPAASQCITYQAAGAATCLATPTRNRTWGEIKSLYR